jgi:phosphoadenosine phosphosulfate reductase
VPLIADARHRKEDIAAWRDYDRQDALWSRTAAFKRRARQALDAVLDFASTGPCYAGTSWGKDSTVLAHLVWSASETLGVEIPLAHCREDPFENPDSPRVRDIFLERWPVPYEEEAEWCVAEDGRRDVRAGFDRMLRRVVARHGPRYLSGIRGQESGDRKRRMRCHGVATVRTCAPIGWWDARDVWAYLHAHDLPIHPVYGMLLGAVLDRDRVRVGPIGGLSGIEFGRVEHEKLYYPVVWALTERHLARSYVAQESGGEDHGEG